MNGEISKGHLTLGATEHQKTPGAGAPVPAVNPFEPAAPTTVHVFHLGSTDPYFGCSVIRPCDIGVVDPTKPGVGGVVTITDLKSFPPRRGVDHMQPNGWAVIGLDTNFYATIGSELEHGNLLGKRADVRFAPIQWNWSYGDGRSARLGTPGASWAALGIPDFDPSPTSHVYEGKGNYTVRLDITFDAQYRYAGGPWTDVVGTIDVPSDPLTVTAGDAKTVLVNRDCTQNPGGPGC